MLPRLPACRDSLGVAHHQIVTLLALQDLAHRLAADRGLDGVLHVGNVQAVARGLLAITSNSKVGLANDAEQADDRPRLLSARIIPAISSPLASRVLQVVAIDLDGKLAFDAAHRFLHVVGDGLREVPSAPGIFAQLRDPWPRSGRPCSRWNTGRQCSLGFRSMKYSVLKKPVVSVPSSGRPTWRTTCITSGRTR